MNYLELQQRANKLVEKVNDYELNLPGTQEDETTLLNQHKYADLYCLRPVMKLLLGATIEEKLNRTLDNDVELEMFASSVPAWNTKFKLFDPSQRTSDEHQFVLNKDMYEQHNMLQLDVYQNEVMTRDERIKNGLNYSYSSNIGDALVTESQVANIFKWNTTDPNGFAEPYGYISETSNNTMTINRQVPGIVCYYLGNDYTGIYTATISLYQGTRTINEVGLSMPPYYGAYYTYRKDTSQVGLEPGAEACRIFIPGMHYIGGQLKSPQQIWQPDVLTEEGNYAANWQGQAIYHELVFKKRRKGCKEAGVDFMPAKADVPDNDPQGFATRLALAKQKDYYYNRPWFTELNELYGADLSALVDKIQEASGSMSDTDFYNNYKLDYDTCADIFDNL